jgi:hypothetical protein
MFDWHLPPSDKFNYENQFLKLQSNDTITLKTLDPLFHSCQLSTSDFLQIWQLVDIAFDHHLTCIQFVYFMHVLNARKRGCEIPFSLPLHIKELFLKEPAKSHVYNRDPIATEAELDKLMLEERSLNRAIEMQKSALLSLQDAEREIYGLCSYNELFFKFLSSPSADITHLVSAKQQIDLDLIFVESKSQELSKLLDNFK